MAQLKRRLLIEQLDELLTWLETDEHDRPELFGSQDEYEWLLRLTAIVFSLLRRHRLDAAGHCRWCHPPQRGWRRWVPRWRGQAPCLVYRTAEFLLHSEPEVVWWQAFSLRGDDIVLDDVRAWLSSVSIPQQPTKRPVSAGDEINRGRHARAENRPARQENLVLAHEADVRPRPYARGGMPTEQFRMLGSSSAEAPTQELPKII